MNIPADLRYTKTHEWIKEENGVVTVGLSDFAQQELGDLVFVNLPQVGDAVTAGEAFGVRQGRERRVQPRHRHCVRDQRSPA